MSIIFNPVIKNKNISFKGHEAQPLKGLVVQQTKTFNGDSLINELNAIAQQYKLNIIPSPIDEVWTQDLFTITPKGRVIAECKDYRDTVIRELNLPKEYKSIPHEQGGNIFYVTDRNGQTVILTGIEEFNNTNKIKRNSENYQADRVIEIPKADFHIDLFLTPIGDNKILLADDNLMLQEISTMIERVKIEQQKEGNTQAEQEDLNIALFNLTKLQKKFKSEIGKNHFAKTSKVKKILEKEGFEVISVPSRIYESYCFELSHKLNYSNAVTFKTDEGETVILTGKSNLNEKMGLTENIKARIGMDFESIFTEAVKDHIKPENIHFIEGGDEYDNNLATILWNYGGGLHCMCAEIPQFEK